MHASSGCGTASKEGSIKTLTNHNYTISNLNPDPSTKQHAVVSIQLNIVVCPMFPEKFILDSVIAQFSLLSVLIVPQRLCSRLTALWRYINFVLLLLLLLLNAHRHFTLHEISDTATGFFFS